MRNYILFFFIVFLSVSCTEQKTEKPNIILVMADDLGYGDISCFGSDFIQTPNLDKLAAEGIRFSDYHSNGSVCSPTRAALMTGNYQQRTGLEGVIYAALDKRKYGIESGEKTMGEFFQEDGYVTGIFGKWHLGYKPEYNPTLHGFDEFYGYVSGNVDYISHRDGIGLHDWWHNTDTCYDEGYVTDLITDRALAFMERNKEQPFLVYLPHEAPHYPYQGRNDKADRHYHGQKFEAHGSRQDKKQAYKEMVEIMDENIGRVMSKLNELEIENNTIVIFCSDNGATKLGSNGNLRGFKGSLWEGGHRVPALLWYPERIKGGQVAGYPVLSMDWLPTLLSMAGIETNSAFDGKDLSGSVLENKIPEDRPVFWRYRNMKVAREGDWKYVKNKDEEYLFNLKEDVGEENNLLFTDKAVADKLEKALAEWEKEMNNYQQRTN